LHLNEDKEMSDKLNELLVEPATGLAYRVRPAQTGGGKAPCLLLLHGVGSNESGFVELARQMDARLTVILLRAPLVLAPNRFAWFPVNFTAAGPVIDEAQAERSRRLLVDFIAALPTSCDIDPGQVWIAGFSQGGIMSASVALTVPSAVAGFGILSGRILREMLPKAAPREQLARLQAFVSHGVQDQTLGIHFAHHAREVLEELGVPLEYREYRGGHALDAAMAGDFQRWLGQRLRAGDA
jgi:phospholipase/carboxylesterase